MKRLTHHEPLRLRAADGFVLHAAHYPPDPAAWSHSTRGTIVLAGATAVPQRFYARFALHAARRGFRVITVDYRGIGASKPLPLRGFEADFLTWGSLDLAAAVSWAATHDEPIYLVGHSFGGQALGLLPDPHLVRRAYTFGTGAGWHGYMPPQEQARVLALWHLLAPILTPCYGYLPLTLLGMGEDTPLGVYEQWRRWAGFPRHIFDDPQTPEAAARYARVRTPIAAATSVDEPWMTPPSRDAFFAGYCNAEVTRIDLDPRALGLPALGHMGYFRSSSVPLWDAALDWLCSS